MAMAVTLPPADECAIPLSEPKAYKRTHEAASACASTAKGSRSAGLLLFEKVEASVAASVLVASHVCSPCVGLLDAPKLQIMISLCRTLVSLRTEDGDGQALHLTHAGAGPLRLRRVRDGGDALGASFRMVRAAGFNRNKV